MAYEIIITKDENGLKPKNFLKKKLDLPFFKIINYIRDKRITLNKKKIKAEDILREGDIIKIWKDEIKLREQKLYQARAKNLGIPIIYEDENLLVLNKLSGIIVQGAQDNEKSLSLHLAYLKQKNNDISDFEYFHGHRLDKDTSGVLICAKNRSTLRDLNQLFRQRETKKFYQTLVIGKPENEKHLIEVYMKRNGPDTRQKMLICSKNENDSHLSISKYKTIETINHNGQIFSLLEVEIKTGLTHQIRVHMKSLKTPVFGDKMYGNSIINNEYSSKLNRQFLHAKHISFKLNGRNYNFEAPLMEDLNSFLDYLKN